MARFSQLSLRQRLEKFPPFLCLALTETRAPKYTKKQLRRRERLGQRKPVARYPFRRLSREEIMAATGFTFDKVRRIDRKRSWLNVTVGDMLAFMEACGVDVIRGKGSRAKIRLLLVRQKMPHLNHSQGVAFAAQIRKWSAEIRKPTPVLEPPSG